MTGPILDTLLSREQEFGPLAERAAVDGETWSCWRLARDEDGVAWLLFDCSDSKVNVLSQAALAELDAILDRLEDDPPHGLVLRSAKASGFCVGADVNAFRDLRDTDDVIAKLQEAHAVADRLAALSCPTLALLHGSCLGGGLEVALCCDYRLALPDARLGLPEILLGLHPGLGGTARLTHLIDPVKAMTQMLTGRTLDARRAKAAGLVDQVIEERHVLRAVRAAMAGEIERQTTGLKDRLLATGPARRLEARQMRSKSAEKANPEHYPAPEALIRLWEEHGDDPEEMRREEIRSFAELLTGETAQNLIRVFFLREAMKHAAKTDAEPVRHLHVIGAGAMGGDIAGWSALQGLRVTLFDTDPERTARVVGQTAQLCRSKHLSESQTRDVLDRLVPDHKNCGIRQADLVIEAVPEKIAVKRKVYQEVEPQLKTGALLATNTSSIPLEELAETLDDPGRFVGLHFFNPVAKMQLVEVVSHDHADEAALSRARGFVGRIDRLPAAVSSAPGFLVNRVLMPYLLEAILLVDEGVAAETVDLAAETFGMPMGPIELADQVGLDICLDVADMLRERLDTAMPELPGWFRERVEEGKLGRKSGEGFYAWEDGRPKKREKKDRPGDDLADRLLLPLLNTAMTCLREKVIAEEGLLDGALIFGTGFAPFRGGPMHYARRRGIDDIVRTLTGLAERHGERFSPDPGWNEQT